MPAPVDATFRNRVLPVLAGLATLLGTAVAGSGTAQALGSEAVPPAELVTALGHDRVRGNAAHAFGTLLGLNREGALSAELIGALERALDSSDEQQRQLAAILLVHAYRVDGTREWRPSLSTEAARGLRSDRMAFNAIYWLGAVYHLAFEAPGRVPEPLVTALESALTNGDLQQRHLAAALLLTIFERQGRGEEAWPEPLIAVLVEGLRDDDVRGGRQVGNLSESFRALYALERRRPRDELRELTLRDDPQAAWAATLLLARYHAGSVQPELTDSLLANLVDDSVVFNEIAAFKSLRSLGEENLRELLRRLESGEAPAPDAQQAAFVQCLAAWFGIEWRPAEAHLERWLAWAEERQRIGTAALFLTPGRDAYLAGRRVPEPLARMVKLGPRSGDPIANSRWAVGWIWWLETDDEGSWLGTFGLWPATRQPYQAMP